MASLKAMIRFGNPLLREKTTELSIEEIKSSVVQKLISDLKACIRSEGYGVGLAAPQIGENLRIAIVDIKPTALRPNVEKFAMTIINPSYEGIGRRRSLWEGCLSSGGGDDTLYGKGLRYAKIRATWLDEFGKKHDEELNGLVAHVFQHETDHLNGILFVDRVRDPKTYMLADEYRERIAGKKDAKPIRELHGSL